MNRLQAIKIIIDNLVGDELIVNANGAISRESFFCKDRKENFYLLGSMGLPASVGLGIAVTRPERKVIILDGDGNVLMGFGNLALIGALKPQNLVHIVLDNQAYGTTGNQPTISSKIFLDRIALASGYRSSCCVETEVELPGRFSESLAQLGPHFIQVNVTREVIQKCNRIPYSAPQIKERFKSCLL
jgi:thiamine pyrophosphate-dependent acetolactate synthase large subunit-like protein